METTEVSFDRGLDKEDVWHIYNGCIYVWHMYNDMYTTQQQEKMKYCHLQQHE